VTRQKSVLFGVTFKMLFCLGVIFKIDIYTGCDILNVTYIQVCGSSILWYP
jgi:hypothetical protein